MTRCPAAATGAVVIATNTALPVVRNQPPPPYDPTQR